MAAILLDDPQAVVVLDAATLPAQAVRQELSLLLVVDLLAGQLLPSATVPRVRSLFRMLAGFKGQMGQSLELVALVEIEPKGIGDSRLGCLGMNLLQLQSTFVVVQYAERLPLLLSSGLAYALLNCLAQPFLVLLPS